MCFLLEKTRRPKCHSMIQCDCCSAWYHSSCQNLTKTEATLISDRENKGIKWVCGVCKPMLIMKTTDQATTTMKLISTYFKRHYRSTQLKLPEMTNINEMWNLFSTKLKKVIANAVPTRTRKHKHPTHLLV